jgi:hypothetical protein
MFFADSLSSLMSVRRWAESTAPEDIGTLFETVVGPSSMGAIRLTGGQSPRRLAIPYSFVGGATFETSVQVQVSFKFDPPAAESTQASTAYASTGFITINGGYQLTFSPGSGANNAANQRTFGLSIRRAASASTFDSAQLLDVDLFHDTWYTFILKTVVTAGVSATYDLQVFKEGENTPVFTTSDNLSDADFASGANAYVGLGTYGSTSGVIIKTGTDVDGTLPSQAVDVSRVYPLVPDDVGSHSEWSSTSGDNYQNVDDDGSNIDGNSVSSAVSGDLDMYNTTDPEGVPASSTVDGVSVHVLAESSAGNTLTLKVSTSGAPQDLGSDITLPTQTGAFGRGAKLDPTDGLAFDQADLAGLQIGVEVP